MKKQSEVKFSMRSVDELIPYARNARTHSAEQVSKIAGSIKEFGFLNPVIISEDGGILAGHGRVLAAQKLGLKEVPCIEESHLTEIQKKAYILADNKIALDAGWDEEMLKIEFNELSNLDFDISLTGFEKTEIETLLEEQEEKEDTSKEVDFKTTLEIIVECETEIEQESLYEEFKERGLKCRLLGL